MIEISPTVFIYSLFGFLALMGSIITVYVSLTRKITILETKDMLREERICEIENTLKDHDGRFNKMFEEIKDGIHRLEKMILKNNNNYHEPD
jgi:hypothetical protein